MHEEVAKHERTVRVALGRGILQNANRRGPNVECQLHCLLAVLVVSLMFACGICEVQHYIAYGHVQQTVQAAGGVWRSANYPLKQ